MGQGKLLHINLINLNTDVQAKVLFILDKNIMCLFKDCFEGIIQINDINNHETWALFFLGIGFGLRLK